MNTELRFGAGSLPLSISERCQFEVLSAPSISVPNDFSLSVDKAIHSASFLSTEFSQLKSSSTVAILVDGPGWITPSNLLLSRFLEMLSSQFFSPENVTILVTNYDDTEPNYQSANEFLADPLGGGHNLQIHDPYNDSELLDIGSTATLGNQVFINEAFAHADLRLAIGSIFPVPFIGATGGGMSVLPGIIGRSTRLRNRREQAKEQAPPLDCKSLSALDIAEAAGLAGLDFIINSVHDQTGAPFDLVAGEADVAWNHGINLLKRVSVIKQVHRADMALVSTGGHPFDTTLSRAVNALPVAMANTRQGGVIILVAECSNGVGLPGFVNGMKDYDCEDDFLHSIEYEFQDGMERSRLLWRLLSSRRLILCTRLTKSFVAENLHCEAVSDLDEALSLAKNSVGPYPRTAIIPYGAGITSPMS